MMAAAMMPEPGAAKGVVPKNGIGIAFWIDGVPGSADIVKVDVPSAMAAGINRRGMLAARNIACAMAPERRRRRTGSAALGKEYADEPMDQA
jgi:hypothetical protein